MVKREAKDKIKRAIHRIGKKIAKNPYLFLNENDIRNMVVHNLLTHFKHEIKVISSYKKDKPFQSKTLAVHSESFLYRDRNNSEKQSQYKPDILVYYLKESRSLPVKFWNDKIHFYAKKENLSANSIKNKRYQTRILKAKSHIEKRALIEFKLSKTKRKTQRAQEKFFKKIKNDFDKLKGLGAKYKFIVCIDRYSKLNDKYISKIKNLTKNNRDFFIYYIGCKNEKKGGLLVFNRGRKFAA